MTGDAAVCVRSLVSAWAAWRWRGTWVACVHLATTDRGEYFVFYAGPLQVLHTVVYGSLVGLGSPACPWSLARAPAQQDTKDGQ